MCYIACWQILCISTHCGRFSVYMSHVSTYALYCLFYRALLQKRLIILPCHFKEPTNCSHPTSRHMRCIVCCWQILCISTHCGHVSVYMSHVSTQMSHVVTSEVTSRAQVVAISGAVAGVPEAFVSTPFQVAVCCSVLRCRNVLQCVVMGCSVLQCVAVWCNCGSTRGFRVNAFSGRSVLQCVAEGYSVV